MLGLLGKGNFGHVYKAVVVEDYGIPSYLAAVKMLRQDNIAAVDDALKEAALMAQFENAFVVGLIGVVTVEQPLLVIIEYCEHGALSIYLKRNNLSNSEKTLMAADCAEGLAYLAANRFIHRDVAARNVLVSSELRGKISDFGMSRKLDPATDSTTSTGVSLPVRWSAPETLELSRFSEQSDVWSFGVLMWEIWSKADMPFKALDSNSAVWNAITGGQRLQCPPGCPSAAYDVMRSCWNTCGERPAFSTLVPLLRGLDVSDEPSDSGMPVSDVSTQVTVVAGYFNARLESSQSSVSIGSNSTKYEEFVKEGPLMQTTDV